MKLAFGSKKFFGLGSLLVIVMMALQFSLAPFVFARADFSVTTMPNGTVGQNYSFQFQATGGSTPYSYEKWYTTYPATDVTLSSTGQLTGIPSKAGNWEWGVRLVDGTGTGVYGIFNWTVGAGTTTGGALQLATTTMPNGTAGQNYSFQFSATGGTGPYTWQNYSTTHPCCYVGINATTGVFSNTGSGLTPLAGTWQIGIKVTDSAGATVSKVFTWTVSPAGTTTTGPVLTVSLNSQSPGAASIPTGIQNFYFSSIKLMATGGDVALTNVQVGSDSASASSFSNVSVYKNASVLLGSTASLSNTSGSIKYGTVTFATPLVIASGTSITLDITANVSTQATGTLRLGVNALQFGAASGNATISGTLPVYGNIFTLPNSTTITTPVVTIVRDTAIPLTSTATPGQQNVSLAAVKVSVTQADAYLYSFSLGGATTTDLDKLESFRMQGSNGSINGVTSSGTSLFTLSQPLLIPKNTTQSFTFFANVKSGAIGIIQPRVTTFLFKDTSGTQLAASQVTLDASNGTTLTISPTTTNNPVSIISPDTLPDATVGQPYAYKFAASGGTAPYTWSLQSADKYHGYRCCYTSLQTDGTFSSSAGSDGFMPDAGSYEVGLRVVDSLGVAAEKIVKYMVKPQIINTQTATEGYIDFLSPTVLSGWAFRNNQLPSVSIVFENTANTATTYTLAFQPSVVRQDVSSYLNTKYGLTVNTPTGFIANPTSVITTNGTYRIKTATFDGVAFSLSPSAKQTFIVGTATTTTGTGKYVRVDGDPTVYWVTAWGAKMPMLSAEVFLSYGAKWGDIQIISQEDLDVFDDVDYIRQQGNGRVYKIEGSVKRYVTPAAATRLAIDPNKVANVNRTEFVSYRTGKNIQ